MANHMIPNFTCLMHIIYLHIALFITAICDLIINYKNVININVDIYCVVFQFATVYKARDIETNKIVAVKKVSFFVTYFYNLYNLYYKLFIPVNVD